VLTEWRRGPQRCYPCRGELLTHMKCRKPAQRRPRHVSRSQDLIREVVGVDALSIGSGPDRRRSLESDRVAGATKTVDMHAQSGGGSPLPPGRGTR
jgi:hypothetical protein